MNDFIKELNKQYEIIVRQNLNLDAEIDCIVRQKQQFSSNYTELIKAQSKLNDAEYLLRNILDDISKYIIIENDINQQLQIATQQEFQKKQFNINKKHETYEVR